VMLLIVDRLAAVSQEFLSTAPTVGYQRAGDVAGRTAKTAAETGSKRSDFSAK
jgi:hypothetical protein